MSHELEILVHISASTSLKNDQRAKQQAQAYLNATFHSVQNSCTPGSFEGGHNTDRIDVTSVASPDYLNYTHCHVHEDVPPELADSFPTIGDKSAVYVDNTQFASTALESQIESSSIKLSATSLLPSKRKRGAITSVHIAAAPHTEKGEVAMAYDLRRDCRDVNVEPRGRHARFGESDTSPLDDASRKSGTPSSYLKSPELNRQSKTVHIDKEYPQRNLMSSSLVHHLAQIGANGLVPEAGSHTAANGGSDDQDTSVQVSELPTTYNLSDVASESPKAKGSSFQRSTSDPGPIPISHDSRISEQDLTATVQPPLEPVAERTVNTARRPTVSAQGAACRSPLKHSELISQNDLQNRPEEFHPPPPETADIRFVTHITENLRLLATNSAVVGRYQPVAVGRELTIHERGYWLIDPSSWRLEEQINFWDYLGQCIGSGTLGWGVWCSRSRDNDTIHWSPGPSANCIGWVKVFCWEEVVEHIYLLLYVASSSKVRKAGLKFVDPHGNVLVRMRGSDQNK